MAKGSLNIVFASSKLTPWSLRLAAALDACHSNSSFIGYGISVQLSIAYFDGLNASNIASALWLDHGLHRIQPRNLTADGANAFFGFAEREGMGGHFLNV